MHREAYYYKPKKAEIDKKLRASVIEIFEKNKRVYGQKKLYKALRREGVSIGKETLAKIVKEEKLVSKYVLRRKPKQAEDAVNNDQIPNKIGREFSDRKPLEVVVSDLTYVDINRKWHYICLLIELGHREIIGFSAGENKDAELVKKAWMTVRKDIREICIFHTDRGGEFKNETIDEILDLAGIERSLSSPGTPIDNAVCESMYDIVKTEFIFEEIFVDLLDLQNKLAAWVWWYNNERLHSSLGYKTPVESSSCSEIGATSDKLVNKKYQKFWKKVALHTQEISVQNN